MVQELRTWGAGERARARNALKASGKSFRRGPDSSNDKQEVTDCRVGGGALARWPPSASHTARADFPHAAFTKTQVFRDAKEGMNPTRWSINEWTFLAPVRLIQSTSLLGHGRTGFSLKELFRPPISLLIWFPFSS